MPPAQTGSPGEPSHAEREQNGPGNGTNNETARRIRVASVPEGNPLPGCTVRRILRARDVSKSVTGVRLRCPGIVRSLSLYRSRRDRPRRPCETPPTTSGSFLSQSVIARNGGLPSRCSIDAAEDRGPMLFARMGIVRALEAHVEGTLDPARHDSRQGNLKTDRDAKIGIGHRQRCRETPEGFPSWAAESSRTLAVREHQQRTSSVDERSTGAADKLVEQAAAGRLRTRLCHLPYSEVVDPLAGLQFGSQPTRRLPSSRPGLGRPIRILKFRHHRWIGAPPCRNFVVRLQQLP